MLLAYILYEATISASNFLARFDNVDKFNNFVKTFYFNEYTQVALPLLLAKEIDGLGFALACDFLKDNGYPEFVKPDVHIKKIFKGIELSDSDEDYEVYKDVIRFAKEIGEIPFRVD
jgi:thermostable 8-oxoguanine DNA glycosylase